MLKPEPNDIIIISLHENHAWQIIQEGYFITADGKKYEFDFSENYQKLPIEEIFKLPQTNGTQHLNDTNIAKIIDNIGKIPESIKFNIHTHGCDIGQTTIFAVKKTKSGTHVIEIGSTGDDCRIPDEPHAKTIFNMF